MHLPTEIVARIEQILAATSKVGGHIDNEAARHGGIALMGTIGAVWILRPDGSFWESDDEINQTLVPLSLEWQHAALACGATRFEWIAPLVPQRPVSAITCLTCQGVGKIFVAGSDAGSGVFCPACFARGWNPAA